MEYHLRYLPPEELGRIYPKLQRDFPPEERKSEQRLRCQMEKGLETGWLLMADGTEVGYAFVLRHPAVGPALLDYLAVEPHGEGHGTALVTLLQNEYMEGGLLAEVESVLPELSEEEQLRRQRCQKFYRKAGFQPTEVENSIYTVPYRIFLWSMNPIEQPTALAAQALDTLYALQLPYEEYCAHVRIEVPETKK